MAESLIDAIRGMPTADEIQAERAETRQKQKEEAPQCWSVPFKKWECGYVWHKAHPKTKGGPKWHGCGENRGHSKRGDRHKCKGCDKTKRVDPTDGSDPRQARLDGGGS